MARTVPANVKESFNSQESSDVKVILLTINQNALEAPLHVCNIIVERLDADAERVYYGITSRGIAYDYAAFECSIANDESGAAPEASLSIPNASRKIIEAIERMDNSPIRVTMELVFADFPDDVIMKLEDFEMANIKYNDDVITGTITRDLLFSEPCPCHTFNANDYPYLFK